MGQKSQIQQIALAWRYKGVHCPCQAAKRMAWHTEGSFPDLVYNASVQTDNGHFHTLCILKLNLQVNLY